MITKADSIPRRTQAGLAGQDVFYEQFNDISFYVEDAEQEQFYYEILRKLFPTIRITKIFPLGGKDAIIRKARATITNRRKIFLADKDFDDIFRTKVSLPNLFYLKQYSIENYLLEREAIYAIIVEERPRLKRTQIIRQFAVDEFLNKRITELTELFALFMLAHTIRYKNCCLPPERFADTGSKHKINRQLVNNYHRELMQQFPNSQEFDVMIASFKKKAFQSKKTGIQRKHICGKYLCYFTKNKVCSEFKIKSLSNDSFCFRLGQECQFSFAALSPEGDSSIYDKLVTE